MYLHRSQFKLPGDRAGTQVINVSCRLLQSVPPAKVTQDDDYSVFTTITPLKKKHSVSIEGRPFHKPMAKSNEKNKTDPESSLHVSPKQAKSKIKRKQKSLTLYRLQSSTKF